MALSEGDKNTCRELAREIIENVLSEHIKSCPHGRVLLASKWLMIGVMLGSGMLGGGVLFALIKAIGG